MFETKTNYLDSRKDFEHNIHVMIEKIREGKLCLPPSERLKKSLVSINKTPNGRVALNTVNEVARNIANTMSLKIWEDSQNEEKE